METAINYFTVFGGLDIKIDMTKPLGVLIQRHILDAYYDIYDDITKKYKIDATAFKILSGIALGDRRVNSAFRRADIEYHEGLMVLNDLEEKELIRQETSMDFLTAHFEQNEVSDKLIFATPFMRFWFAFVSPLYRGIARGEYDEVYERFENRKKEFVDFIFEQLSHEYVKLQFKEDAIEEIGRYWDEKDEIELLAQTYSGRVIVGSCKYTNNKVKKTEIQRLKEVCERLEIVPDFVMLFSKKGYTTELKSLKNESLRLFTVKSLKGLL